MEEWHLRSDSLKRYPHFDPPIRPKAAEKYATDAQLVAHHPFYPFILYRQRWTRFARKGGEPIVKERPIRYAARRDAYIFSRYRHLLSQPYEAELKRLGIDGSVLAYRHISTKDGRTGKCNIHFAHDAFLRIRDLGNCAVIALDISSYFESLDHARLKEAWARMLGLSKLPDDHFSVFRAITKYSEVDKESAYERLGHFGVKTTKAGAQVRGYLTPFKLMPKRLCNGKKFRELIAGDGAQESIIRRHKETWGIPQGAPISDLLANLYLIDFDAKIEGWVTELGGSYYRYSDDILIVAPIDEPTARDLMKRTQDLIRGFGGQLKIKEEKSSLHIFRQQGTGQTFRSVDEKRGITGLEYLGFRYDGRGAYLRNATISNLLRKITRAAYHDAEVCARRYPDKDALKLRKVFNYERLVKRFGRVENFAGARREHRKWTFWTYARKASAEFGPLGKPILRQLRRHRALIRRRADTALERAVVRRERRKSRARG